MFAKLPDFTAVKVTCPPAGTVEQSYPLSTIVISVIGSKVPIEIDNGPNWQLLASLQTFVPVILIFSSLCFFYMALIYFYWISGCLQNIYHYPV